MLPVLTNNLIFLIVKCLYTGGVVAVLAAVSLVLFWSVAQSAERSSVKRIVVGSSPTRPATLFHLGRNNYRKKELFIIKITKQECKELQKMGHMFGSDRTLHHNRSKGKKRKYYLTESKKALSDLEKIRKSQIVEKY